MTLLAACQELLRNKLSTSSGGDPGMVFDEFDAATERKRKGTVTFDRQAVERFEQAVAQASFQSDDPLALDTLGPLAARTWPA